MKICFAAPPRIEYPCCPETHGCTILACSAASTQTGSSRHVGASCPSSMLPLPLQFIVAMMAHAINERMARQLDYLLEEVRVLREVFTETTGRKRIPFTDEQRKRLAIAGKALTPEERETCCQLVRPKTILDWFRKLAAQKYDGSDAAPQARQAPQAQRHPRARHPARDGEHRLGLHQNP